MGTLQADIQQKQKEIEQHRSDMFALFADLGRIVAPVEQLSSLGYALKEYEIFCKATEEYEKAKRSYEQLSGYISQLEDRSRKIKEIQRDIRLLRKPLDRVFARVGAIAYEAYTCDNLADHLKEACAPFFEDHHRKTKRLEERVEAPGNRVNRFLCDSRLRSLRRDLPAVFIKAGRCLAAIGCAAELPFCEKHDLMSQLENFMQKKSGLEQELEVHVGAMAKLKSEEVQSPKARLEERASQMRSRQKEAEKAAAVYGKALYDTLPSDVNARTIGSRAIELMDQLTLHKNRIKTLQREIKVLENLIQVQELQAQVELDNQRIEMLRSQIETCNRQIEQIESTIAEKQKKITALLPPPMVTSNG